jgi:signal transduction histidine kinase
MPFSRLRLRLAGWFTIAFLAGLLLLSGTLFVAARRQSDTRLTEDLATEGQELVGAIQIEFRDAPDSGVAGAVKAALDEWPARPEAFGVYATDGPRLGLTGPAALRHTLPESWNRAARGAVDLPDHGPRLVPVQSAAPAFLVVAVGPTDRLKAEADTLALWLGVSIPLTILLGLFGGYVLSSRALQPVAELERAIAEIGPDALSHRLPVRSDPDELDRLAARFNALLDELQASQDQNRHFLERAAHQIRTPLTLVLGEAELALDRQQPDGHTDALRRIRLAATQMRRRVEELMLLARASAGERPPMTDTIELDGLAFECADLLRGRAQQLSRRLELTRVEPIVLTGSEPLLREAIVELLENACRHGTDRMPVGLSVFREHGRAVIEVANAASVEAPAATADTGRQPLGLEVVRWIVAEHGGDLKQVRSPATVATAMYLPL